MRLGAMLLLFWGSLAWAGDVVHLENGRILKCTVIGETAESVVVDVGGGEVTIPRGRVRLIERGVLERAPGKLVTQRDEWFLVLHRGKLVGWRRIVHTEGPRRVHVEERTVFFRPGGGDDVDIRRVEVADRAGRPIEFLLSETYGKRTEMVSGHVQGERTLVRIRRGGRMRVKELRLEAGWTLRLPAWSRFLESAEPGETRTIMALDLRHLRPVKLVLTREPDADRNARTFRTLRLVGDFRPSRAWYRPGEGSHAVELNGDTLVAQRASRARVEMARRVHAAPRPLALEDAVRYPFHEKPKDLTRAQVQAGIALTAPDAAWLATSHDRTRGLVLGFEKISLFASLEIFSYGLPSAEANLEACTRAALARVRLTAPGLKPTGATEERDVAGRPARVVELSGIHRGEPLRCRAIVVVEKDRYLLLLGAAPKRWWRWAARDFDTFSRSLDIVR